MDIVQDITSTADRDSGLLPANLQIRTARTVCEVEAIRNVWQKMHAHPNADIDLFLSVNEVRKTIVRPHVMVLGDSSQPSVLVVGRIETIGSNDFVNRLSRKIPMLCKLRIIQGGFLGNLDDDHCQAVFEEILSLLRRRVVHVVQLDHLDIRSNIYRQATRIPQFRSKDHCIVPVEHWTGYLGISYQDYCNSRSKNTRRNLRRYTSLFLSEFDKRWSIKILNQPSDLEQIMRDTEVIAAKTYQYALAGGFKCDNEMRALVSLALNKGWMRAFILYVDRKPVAFWNGIAYLDRFHTWTTGYAPELAKYHVGTFLLARLLENLCQDERINHIDFGFGNAQYKRSYCDDIRHEASVRVYGPGLIAVCMNVAKTASTLAYEGTRRVVLSTKSLQKVRKAWRKRLLKRKE